MQAETTKPGGSTRARLIAVIAVVLAVLLLRMTRSVTMPVVAGMLVAALAWPMKRWWERMLPRPLALLATVLVVIAAVVALLLAIAWGGSLVAERIGERGDRIEVLRERIGRVTGVLDAAPSGGRQDGAPASDAPDPAAESGSASTGGSSGLAQRVMSMAISTASALAFVIAFMALALAEARDAGARVRGRFPEEQARRLLAIVEEAGTAMQRYFVVKSFTSFITGMSTLVITLLFGLDFWWLWGLLAFLLEYVPTIGSVLAVIPPAMYAAVQFDGYTQPLSVVLVLGAAQLFLGNYVDPKIEGHYLQLSPFVVLASIVFWAWVWGPAGSLLGVPLTVAITTVARHFEGTRWIWALLTARGGDE